MSWRIVVTGALLLAALLTGWALWRQDDETAATIAGGRPDYVLEDFELVALNEQGREAFTLRAPRLARSPQDQTLSITTPLFVIPPAAGSQGAPWEVRSRTAWVSADGDLLRLRGNVRATSVDVDGQPVAMATEQMNVFPKTRRVTSPFRVTLTQPGLILNGHGLDARLDAKQVHLNDVKGRYERTAR